MAGLWSLLLAAAVSAVFGVAAWVVANFFAAPLVEFRKLRKEVHESMFFTANVGEISSKEQIASAMVELRRHAAAMSALWVTAPRPVKWYLHWRKYDVEDAATNLTGFSNSINLTIWDSSKATHRHHIEKSLRFPMSYTDEQIHEIRRERSNR